MNSIFKYTTYLYRKRVPVCVRQFHETSCTSYLKHMCEATCDIRNNLRYLSQKHVAKYVASCEVYSPLESAINLIRMADQFDSALGGYEHVPNRIQIPQFAEARCQEIVALNNALEQAQKGGLIFQRLPKAMRRRVMSHTTKRLPRRLRDAHAKQLERNGVPPKSKRPSRKYRRRPQNLLLEYNRRQRDSIWLETHIWHAKRFHMTEKWGYKVANFPNAKSFRACYRASANHCLLQDISYFCCIEIKGPEDILIEGLNSHVNLAVGLTFGAKAFLDGCKEGSLMFFHKKTFPFGAIGTIKFLWKAEEDLDNTDKRTMWLWTHPAFYSEIVECLWETFSLREESSTKDLRNLTDQVRGIEMKKLEAHKVFDSLPIYISNNSGISMTLLKDKLNKFRLTGPLSHSILVDALHVVSISQGKTMPDELHNKDIEILNLESEMEDLVDVNCKDDSKNSCNEIKSSNVESWWRTYYKCSENRRKIHSTQSNVWRSMKNVHSPALLPPHQVVALTTLDPRYQLPVKRTKVVPDSNVLPGIHPRLATNISLSPIWNPEVRLASSASKLSNSEWTKRRTQMVLVPGFSENEINSVKHFSIHNTEEFEPSFVPVLLVQRPGSQDPEVKRLGFSSGWDIIMPAGWAMPFWMALIFRGAKPGGLKEASALGFESGSFSELLAPDSAAGKLEDNIRAKQREDQYFRLPPNKRPNFIKLGITSPFSCPWNTLMNDWCQNKQKDFCGTFYVLRDRTKLDALKSIVNSYKPGSNVNGSTRSDQISQFSNLFSNMNHNCLIPVRIWSIKKGCPTDCAIICIPSAEDLSLLTKNPSFEGPMEPVHCDSRADDRKAFRREHQKELKRLRKQRVKGNNKLKEQMDKLLEKGESISHLISTKKDKMPTKDIVDKYAEEMKLLWIPEAKTVKDTCSRSVAGYICKGDFSLSEAGGVGLGYIPLPAVIHLINTWIDKPVILFRNPNSLQYRCGILKIC